MYVSVRATQDLLSFLYFLQPSLSALLNLGHSLIMGHSEALLVTIVSTVPLIACSCIRPAKFS